MKKILVVLAVLLIALTFTSCYTGVTVPVKSPEIVSTLTRSDYKILGDVSITSDIYNVLGIVSWGGCGYNDLLKKAKELYPDANAVINLYEDKGAELILGVYNRFTKTITGSAVHIIDGRKNYSQEIYAQD